MSNGSGRGGGRPGMARFGLAFPEPRAERAFRSAYNEQIASQARISLLLGSLLYVLLGFEDPWFFPDDYLLPLSVRVVNAVFLLGGLALSWRRGVQERLQGLLFFLSVFAGAGTLSMIARGSAEVANSYCFGLMLIIVWAYTFSGLRFVPALAANALLVLAYVGVQLLFVSPELKWFMTNTGNVLAGSLLAGFAGYLIEWHRRYAYLHALHIDEERRRHAHNAFVDRLTGLPNRLRLEQSLEEALARQRRRGGALALLFIDIDDFKPVNDTWGHQVGDQVLDTIGSRLRQCLRESDIVARYGGDEFVILAEGTATEASVHRLARKVIDKLSRPVPVEAAPGSARLVRIGASIGVARCPGDADGARELIRCADVAMYRAKREGTPVCLYSAEAGIEARG